ncbi:putative leucine rich repeat domain protein [Botrytis fragariae]|uniref:Putative leucine rich repeat domain protein n=1 Tax=Botrytis fragariae TaxID=1964551 RepID=A0A8H6B584_9HELO|nr:putative leucine rich repeat domain protein [Botrytis fragariae]KAF5879475.1 putative leucine rich repeat domain protein [Botrytis fragariae]
MDPLPAYHELNKDVATLVAPYLNTFDLYFGCLVNSHFNEKFGNYLWANPFRDLAQRKEPCGVVTKFFFASTKHDLKTLKRVRILDLRALHEIRRDRAQTKDCVVFGPNLKPEWFFKFVRNFPDLNCILLAPTCPEDYGLATGADLPGDYNGAPQPEFLSAAGCNTFNYSLILNQNITKNLIYLDASETACSTNWRGMFTIQNLPKLRILKLRGLRLTDTMLPPIVTNSRRQIWSLDLRDNLLTDNLIYPLIRGCFLERLPNYKHGPLRATDDHLFEDPPIYCEINESSDSSPTTITTLRPDCIQEVESSRNGMNILERRNNAEDNLLLVTGLTHLYISNNKFTALASKILLASTNSLQVLDIGSTRPNSPIGAGSGIDIHAQEHSIPYLSRKWQPRLEILRIHHSIVTHHPLPTKPYNKNSHSHSDKAPITTTPPNISDPSQTPHKIPTPLRPLQHPTSNSSTSLFPALQHFIRRLSLQEFTIQNTQKNLTSRRAPLLYPGLRELILEFLPEARSADGGGGGASITDDQDADAYHKELARDFSFLSQEDIRTATAMGKEEQGNDGVHDVDIVEELRKWRKREVLRWGGKLTVKLF